MLLKFFKKSKPKSLKDYLKVQFEDQLIPVEMPNVGTYQGGPRTAKKVKPSNQFKS